MTFRSGSKVILLLFLSHYLSACAALAIGGVGATVVGIHDRRTVGTIVDDQGIELAVSKKIGALTTSHNSHINITSYNFHVLLTGEVSTQALGLAVEEAARSISNVQHVYNEMIIAPNASLASRSHDSLVTAKVKTSLLGVNVPGFDPLRVKVVTERGIVYLLGILSHVEAEQVIQQVKGLTGVRQVVPFFQYMKKS